MTDRPRTSRIAASPLELRLYVVAVLAGVYLLTWRSIAGAGAPTSALPAVPASPDARRVVWLDELPAARRPPLTVPPGWRVVSRDEPATTTPRPVVVRAATRPVRVRTRSS
jgi:hypothetical protein